jgi:hypothetical protein
MHFLFGNFGRKGAHLRPKHMVFFQRHGQAQNLKENCSGVLSHTQMRTPSHPSIWPPWRRDWSWGDKGIGAFWAGHALSTSIVVILSWQPFLCPFPIITTHYLFPPLFLVLMSVDFFFEEYFFKFFDSLVYISSIRSVLGEGAISFNREKPKCPNNVSSL